MYRNTTVLCMLILDPEILLNLLVLIFFDKSIYVFLYVIWQLQTETILLLPFWFGCLFFFFCIIALANTFHILLNTSSESERPCIFSDLRGKAFSFSPFIKMFTVDLACMSFIMLSYILSISILLRVVITKVCWILSHAF